MILITSEIGLDEAELESSDSVSRQYQPNSRSPYSKRRELSRGEESEQRSETVPPIPVWKHFLDLSFLLLTLPIWIPLMCVIAIGIKIVSRGPIFFRQERIGYNRKPFRCLKFRSMKADADTSIHSKHVNNLIVNDVPMTKMDSVGDARLIRCGLLLRSTGLDELPQFINVLVRQMSLVGPRPCVREEYAQYSDWQKERFDTLPGLTGLWQVSGKNRTTFRQMVDLDVRYAKSKTLWMDLGIILKTLPAIFTQVQDTKRENKTASLVAKGEPMKRRLSTGT
jgi:lipopolysaccharide/colanic/teichoic acid biosynthesis glycosyltransferase